MSRSFKKPRPYLVEYDYVDAWFEDEAYQDLVSHNRCYSSKFLAPFHRSGKEKMIQHARRKWRSERTSWRHKSFRQCLADCFRPHRRAANNQQMLGLYQLADLEDFDGFDIKYPGKRAYWYDIYD